MSAFKPEILSPIKLGLASTAAPPKLYIYSDGQKAMWIDNDGVHVGGDPTEAAKAFVQVLGRVWDDAVKQAASRDIEAAYDEGYARGYEEAQQPTVVSNLT